MVYVRQKGFTVLELLIVISILALLAGLAVPRLSTATAERDLDIAARQLATDMRWMQQNALNLTAGATNPFILSDSQPALVLYTTAPYGYFIKSGTVTLKEYFFPNNVKISGYYSAIYFGINGYVNNALGTTVTLMSGNKTKKVIVDAVGRIRIE